MTVRVGVVGTGGIAAGIHLPGLKTNPEAKIVALCDVNQAALDKTAAEYGVERTFTDYEEMCAWDGLDAVIIATPNIMHKPIALAAIRNGKHVMVEKPLTMDMAGAREMWQAAREAQVRNQVAFNYRFIPAMRYMKHLVETGMVGEPYHFRAQRFQDWGMRAIGWRQMKSMAATGELGDMASHRIDYAHYLLGPITRVSGMLKQFVVDRTNRVDGSIQKADVDDWACLMGEFASGASCVIESTKLAAGRGSGGKGHDLAEINGSEGSLLFHLHTPYQIQYAKRQEMYQTMPVPHEFLTVSGTQRDPNRGDPTVVSRYDQAYAFVDAIAQGRECDPSFTDGLRAQAVMEAVLESAERQCVVDVEQVEA